MGRGCGDKGKREEAKAKKAESSDVYDEDADDDARCQHLAAP
jgi:hypothetical protein